MKRILCALLVSVSLLSPCIAQESQESYFDLSYEKMAPDSSLMFLMVTVMIDSAKINAIKVNRNNCIVYEDDLWMDALLKAAGIPEFVWEASKDLAPSELPELLNYKEYHHGTTYSFGDKIAVGLSCEPLEVEITTPTDVFTYNMK
jgi:hypothetical protein